MSIAETTRPHLVTREAAAARIEALEAALRERDELIRLMRQSGSRKPNPQPNLRGSAALAPEQVKPVMAASEKAAEVVSGWSDAKKDYASRAVPSEDNNTVGKLKT